MHHVFVDDLATGRAIQAYGAEHPTQYAGIWLEDGVFFVAFTGDLDRHIAGLRAAAPDASVRVVSAARTVGELEEILSEIEAAYLESDDHLAMERGLVSIGLNTPTNTIAVGVLPIALELAAEIAGRWGSAVTVRHAQPGVAL